MTDYSAAFRECLVTLDVALIRKLWRHVRPGMPQPDNDDDALASLHMSRTQIDVIEPKLRMYSHSWLTERGLPSMLPDHMRASAERLYPVATRAVGISVNMRSPLLRGVKPLVEATMATAVLEGFADRASDDVIRRHMMEARQRELGKLLGKRHG